ncbi:hypothetical protein RUM_06260 [Ruminococcus champanellensis 18P13 = JCM 17042]|uniref:Uncharacterized protein n=1 Tax=Ruminococcus champanellensis (strain DSM 18848 / JCM 17042 / KCTC 15320 / 18P13) TaxID=213810 RepID=D4LB47_RUMC1|nr:hypothetical protein [Ruminococcus champanellensis]CBL16842.1 hypothetical protein RUM_06260 [Ruminococcus champanellensis 18P13 = JCM 17042]
MIFIAPAFPNGMPPEQPECCKGLRQDSACLPWYTFCIKAASHKEHAVLSQ